MSQPRSQRSPITAYLNFTTPSLHGTPTPVPIHDARVGGEKALDTHGFTLVPFPQPVLSAAEFYDDDTVRAVYYAKLADELKMAFGATRAVPIAHHIRNGDQSFCFDSSGKSGNRKPRCSTRLLAEYVPLVHADNNFQQGKEMMQRWLSRDGDGDLDLDKHRYQIVNVWRNIRDSPIQEWNHPLAVLDASTMNLKDDFVRTATELPKLSGPRDYHRWYWFPSMTRQELLVFRRWDSRGTAQPDRPDGPRGLPGDVRGVSTFHTAWATENPFTEYLDGFAAPGRESIDTLVMLIYDL